MATNDDTATRDKILHEAFGLFLLKGYENTPVQAIIDAVGIAKGTFYHHFKGKEEMLVSLVEEMSRRVYDAVAPVVADPDLDAVQKMLKVSRVAVAQKAADFGPEVILLVRQMRSKANRLLADSIGRISRQWILPLYARIIAEGAEQGQFRVGHPGLAAELVLGTILSMQDRVSDLLLAFADGDSGALDRLVEVYGAIEEAVERILGTATGTLPIYSSIDVRALMARLSPGGTP